MFYQHTLFTGNDFEVKTGTATTTRGRRKQATASETKIESALVTLNPADSKCLIGKAVAVLPEVRAALKKGYLIINWGTTNACVVEALLGVTIPEKSDFVSGLVADGELNAIAADVRMQPFVLKDGKPSDLHQRAALARFKPGDVFIKGANAVDIKGDVGILVDAQTSISSAYQAWFATVGRGGTFICPVGLEKLIPSVDEAVKKCNLYRFKYSTGMPCSLIPFCYARVVTEIQAVKVLTGATATHVASGGIAGSEGAVTLAIEGEPAVLERAFELIKSVRGQPLIKAPKKYRNPPSATFSYDSQALLNPEA